MLENRHINLIIIVLMAICIAFTSILVVSPQSLGMTPSSSSEVEYASLLFDKSQVSEINIEMAQEDWDTLMENAKAEEYQKSNITINGETFYNVGIRAKGNSSLNTVASSDSNRYSFKIKFDKYVTGQTYYGLDEFVVNNMMSDATYMKEYISYDIYEKMGIATPLFAFTNINVNNEPWGLYLAVEVTEENFLNRNFGTDYGNLYKPEDTGSSLVWVDENHSSYQGIKDNAQTDITDKDFDKVVEMIQHLNSGTDLEKYLDVEQILKYFAINNLIVNLDSYVGNFNHNYMLYEEDGVFSVLPWDLNMAFGGFQSRSAQQAVDLSIDTPYNGNAENYPLFTKLIEVPEYKEIYHNYLQEIVTLYFDSGIFSATIDSIDNLINEYVKNDATAFYDYEAYTTSLPVLKEFGKLRAKSVIAQLAGETTAGTVDLDLSALGSMGGGGGMGGDMAPGGNMERPNNIEDSTEGQRPNRPNMGNNANQNGMMAPPDNNMGAMFNRENTEEIMAIMQEFDGELTDEQIAKLKELGLDDTAIESLKNMPTDMMIGNDKFPGGNQDNGGRGGGFPGGDMGRDGNRPGTSQNIIPSLIITGVSTLVLLIGILFIYQFKRRKYLRGLSK